MTETDSHPLPRRHARRVMRHSARTLWVLVLLPLVFAGAMVAMMIDRDITAPSWVSERIEARLAALLGGGALEFGTITFHLGRDLHPRVRLSETVLTDAEGRALARVSQMTGQVSPRGLLFDRAALLQTVSLSGAQIDLRRRVDGSVAVAFGRGAQETQSAPSLAGLLDGIDAIFARPALAALEQVDLDGLVINYTDARAGRVWTVDGGRLTLDLTGGQTRLEAGMAVLSGGRVGTLALRYASPDDSRAASIALDIEDLPAADIATQSPALAWLAALDAPLSAVLTTGLDEAGGLGPLHAALRIGAGDLRPGQGPAAGVGFGGADVVLRYDPQARLLQFDRVSVDTPWGVVQGTGQGFDPGQGSGLPESLVGQFSLPGLALNPAGLYDGPLALGDVSVDMRLHLRPFRIELGQVALTGPEGRVTLSGQIAAGGEGWSAALDAHADRLARDRVMAFWPGSLRPGVRGWFARNLTAGAITDLTLGWRQEPRQAPVLAMDFGFEGAHLQFMPSLPPVRAGEGHASLIDNRFVLQMGEGHADAPQGGEIAMAGSVLVIPDMRQNPADLELDLVLDSSITAGLSVLDQPPFRFLSRANLPVTLADGRARSRVRLQMPLRFPVPPGGVIYAAHSDLSRVRSDRLVPGRRLVASALTVSADNAQLSVSGAPVLVDDVPLRGTWTQIIGQPGSQVSAEVPLTPAALASFGIRLPGAVLSGAAGATLLLDLGKGTPPRYRLSSDLVGAAISLPQIGWTKPAAQRGALDVAGRLGARPSIDTLELGSAGLQASGAVEFDAQGGLEAVRLTRLRIADWFDAPVTLRGRGNRPPGIEVAGGVLDLRRARFGGAGSGGASGATGASGGAGGPIELSLGRLQVAEGVALTGFRGNFSTIGGLSGSFTARVNDGAGLRGTVAPRDGRTAIRVQSDDAGGLIRSAGFVANGVGGVLDAALMPAGGAGGFDGTLAIRDIRVRDVPAIAALLNTISVVGLLQQLDGEGIVFDTVDAQFRLTPERVIVTEASAVGPSLGLSLDGTYGLASKVMDFQGVVSPLYLINAIGAVLTRRGEGLIGFNFTLAGTATNPQVGVNPLSALTPGMFRDIFRRPPPEVPQ